MDLRDDDRMELALLHVGDHSFRGEARIHVRTLVLHIYPASFSTMAEVNGINNFLDWTRAESE